MSLRCSCCVGRVPVLGVQKWKVVEREPATRSHPTRLSNGRTRLPNGRTPPPNGRPRDTCSHPLLSRHPNSHPHLKGCCVGRVPVLGVQKWKVVEREPATRSHPTRLSNGRTRLPNGRTPPPNGRPRDTCSHPLLSRHPNSHPHLKAPLGGGGGHGHGTSGVVASA